MNAHSPATSRDAAGEHKGTGMERLQRTSMSPIGFAVTLCEVSLGGMFGFAAWLKLWPENAPQVFSASVQAFKLPLPDLGVRLATSVVPWIEVVTAACLIIGLWTRAAALVLGGLLMVFIGLIVQALVRNLDVKCGCFGELSPFCGQSVSGCNIVQNIIMLGLAMFIVFTPRWMVSSNAAQA